MSTAPSVADVREGDLDAVVAQDRDLVVVACGRIAGTWSWPFLLTSSCAGARESTLPFQRRRVAVPPVAGGERRGRSVTAKPRGWQNRRGTVSGGTWTRSRGWPIQAACVSVFIVTLASSGVRVPAVGCCSRLTVLRGASSALPVPSCRLPGLRGFVLGRCSRCSPSAALRWRPSCSCAVAARLAARRAVAVPWIALVAAGRRGSLALVGRRARPWAERAREVSRGAARCPLDRRDEMLPHAFDTDPQLQASAAAVGRRGRRSDRPGTTKAPAESAGAFVVARAVRATWRTPPRGSRG